MCVFTTVYTYNKWLLWIVYPTDIKFQSFCIIFLLESFVYVLIEHKYNRLFLVFKWIIKHIVHHHFFVSTINGVIFYFIFYFLIVIWRPLPLHPALPFSLSAKQAVDLDKWVCLLTCLISCNVCPKPTWRLSSFLSCCPLDVLLNERVLYHSHVLIHVCLTFTSRWWSLCTPAKNFQLQKLMGSYCL